VQWILFEAPWHKKGTGAPEEPGEERHVGKVLPRLQRKQQGATACMGGVMQCMVSPLHPNRSLTPVQKAKTLSEAPIENTDRKF
jgi:hypothetical protein